MPNSELARAFAALIFGALFTLASSACNPSATDVPAPQPTASATQSAAEARATPESIEPIAAATDEPTAMSAAPEPTEAARSAYTFSDSSVAIYELPPTPAPNEPEWIDGYPPTPAEPPAMLIVGESADGESVAEGAAYYVQWLERDEAEFDDDIDLRELMAEVMPTPTRLGSDRLLRIMTGSRTRLIMVAGFDDLNPASEAEYDVDESEFWECTRSNANPCERINADGFAEYHRIPPAVLQHRYISVFAMWSVAPTLKDDKIAPSDLPNSVSANWLFHLADE